MSTARQLDPRPAPEQAPEAPAELDDTLAGIAEDARSQPAAYARDTRVPAGCE